MSVFNWVVFVSILFGIYLSGVLYTRIARKKWNFKVALGGITWVIIMFFPISYISDFFAHLYVKKNISYEIREEVISEQKIDDIVRDREKEGNFFLGFGSIRERETFRYSIKNQDGTIKRERIYTADCLILKSDDKNQKVLHVKKVRIYKNPKDMEFWKNDYDSSDGFYKVYIL